MLVGNDFADDAAVVRFGGAPERGLVLTTDVITPIVDDPATFGAIAACNALSDVYAMGGRPLHALSLVFFPDDQLPLAVLREILRGSADLCRRAGVAVVGGHSVRDAEIKHGLAVTGEVPLGRILSNRGAGPGERLVLTKAIGTGVIGSAIRAGKATPPEIDAAVASMTTLNAGALECALRRQVSAATDVTGFGLLGHLRNILRGSGLAAALHLDRLPLLPGAQAHLRAGVVPGGTRANLRFLEPALRRRGPDEHAVLLAADAQTSGGLLLAVAPADAPRLIDDLRALGLPAADLGQLLAPTPADPAGTTFLE